MIVQKAKDSKRLKISLTLTFARAGQSLDNKELKLIESTIKSTFPNMTKKDIFAAIKNGGTGFYGSVFKMSCLEICIWIRKYQKDNRRPNGNIDF